jgi:hypothetical protein
MPVLPAARSFAVVQFHHIVLPPALSANDVEPTRRQVAASRVETVQLRSGLRPAEMSPIEPLQTESIAIVPISLVQLEREYISIESISIDGITIEPLSASNH